MREHKLQAEPGDTFADWYKQHGEELDFLERAGLGYAAFAAHDGEIEQQAEEIKGLNTWTGLISLLDKHYPPDIFDGRSCDPGPRIVALTREVAWLRAIVAKLPGWADELRDIRNDIDSALSVSRCRDLEEKIREATKRRQ